MSETADSIRTKKNDELFFEIVYIFIAPVALLYLGVIPYTWRVVVLFAVVFLIIGIIRYQRWSSEKLGVVKLTKRAAIAYAAFTIIGSVALIASARALGFQPFNLTIREHIIKIVLLFIPLSVLQEVAYRGYLSARLRELFNNRTHRVLINAALFTLLHIIYPAPYVILPAMLLAGICFAELYERYPNLLAISVSHSILNLVAVLFGFFL